MKYLVLLIGQGEVTPWGSQTPEEQAAEMARFESFPPACREREGVVILAGEALAGPEFATTTRVRGGQRTVTDGPYAESVEQLGGFYLLEAPDLDTVLELVEILPPYDLQIIPVIDPYA